MATSLSFINTLYTRSESNLPILMENNKNHQITLPKGRIGFSSLDVVDQDEPKYQIRSPYELPNAILSLLMNDTKTVFFYIQQFQHRPVMNFSKLSMEVKIQFFTNLIQ